MLIPHPYAHLKTSDFLSKWPNYSPEESAAQAAHRVLSAGGGRQQLENAIRDNYDVYPGRNDFLAGLYAGLEFARQNPNWKGL